MTKQSQLTLIWFVAASIAVLFAMNMNTAAYVDGGYVPIGNDSFYHARRILDVALGTRDFYEFDDLMHVPEGSWLTWPWAYDFLVAKLVQGLHAVTGWDPMTILVHVPVFWIFINAALLLGVTGAVGLSIELRAIAMLGFAFSPLTQLLHGVAVIDHHYIEYTFVLASLLTGLRWFEAPDNSTRAALFGLTLGIAPAFHNGLFILQLPLLITMFLLWVRGESVSRAMVAPLAIALTLATAVMLLPSDPFRDGQFEYATFSWFHLYISVCSAILLTVMGSMPCSRRNLAGLTLLGIVLGALILNQALSFASVLNQVMGADPALTAGADELLVLQSIEESKSLLDTIASPGGWRWAAQVYSALVWTVPLLLIIFVASSLREGSRQIRYFSVMAVLGLCSLMLTVRAQYFGSFALMLGWLVVAEWAIDKYQWRRFPVAAGCLGIYILAHQVAVKDQLFANFSVGLDVNYEITRALYPSLADACHADAGLVIADHNDGHYVRYHSDCSVLANNFLLTPQHRQKVGELLGLLKLSPDQFIARNTGADYIFVRLEHLYLPGTDGELIDTTEAYIRQNNHRLFGDLVFDSTIPPQFELIAELPIGDGRDFSYARLFRIRPAGQ